MDEKPFLEINITELKESQIEELKKFHKSYFDIESILSSASELKYTMELKNIIQKELSNPSPEFVKHFAKQVYQSVITAKVLEQFTNLVKKSIQQHISDLITERLKTALKKEDETSQSLDQSAVDSNITEESKIVTTEEEIESYLIVKAILRQKINVDRIYYRDAQSYFAILLDDNNRKTICRLYLNYSKKYLVFLDESKKEIKYEIQRLDDIFKYQDKLFEAVERLEKNKIT